MMVRTQTDQKVSEGGEQRLNQQIKLPGMLPVLDPTQVREHRHSRETPA
jgi:hypothetical protein